MNDSSRLSPPAGKRNSTVAIDLSNVAFAHWGSRRLVEAAAGYERSLEMRRQLADTDPKDAYALGRVAYAHSRLGGVYNELGQHTDALRHAEAAVRIGDSQAAINATYAALFADYLRGLGEVQLGAHRVAAACASFRRSQAVLVDLSAKGISDSSSLAERIRNQIAGVTRGLAACGPRAEQGGDPRKP